MFKNNKTLYIASILVLMGVGFLVVNASKNFNEGGSDSPAKTVKTNGFFISNVKSVSKPNPNKAVDFTWEENGKTMSFAEVTKGKVVFLNFWATWCPPCRKEIPDIVKIRQSLPEKDIVVIGIALERDNSDQARINKVKDFADKNGLNYHNFVDAKGELQAAYGGVSSIPTTFIIDRQGNIKEQIVGMQEFFAFMGSINKVLK